MSSILLGENNICLLPIGLDPSGYRHAASRNDEDDALLGGAQISDEERYQNCERLKVKCPDCGKELILDGPTSGVVSKPYSFNTIILNI